MITLNLFDNTFRHAVCSVAGKTPRSMRYERDQMAWAGVTLFVDGYLHLPVVDEVESRYKVGWLHEPPCLHPENYRDIPAHKFDMILTYDPGLLAGGSPFRFAPYGGVWLPHVEWGLRPKPELVSMLVGDKTATEGHRLRRRVADRLEATPVDFYGSRGTPVGYGWKPRLRTLADYAFSLIVEPCRIDNLFTAWLLDCFAAGTVPVYWGCPNLAEFFDARGVLAFETEDEALEVVDGLDFDLYRSLLPYAAANLRAVYEYEITEDWLISHVLKELT